MVASGKGRDTAGMGGTFSKRVGRFPQGWRSKMKMEDGDGKEIPYLSPVAVVPFYCVP